MDTGGRDVEGRRVVYYRPNDYCPSEVPYTDLLRYLVFTLEMATREDEDAQKNGIAFVCDMRGWTWDNFEYLYAHAFFQTVQFVFPVFIAKFILVDPPSWFSQVRHFRVIVSCHAGAIIHCAACPFVSGFACEGLPTRILYAYARKKM